MEGGKLLSEGIENLIFQLPSSVVEGRKEESKKEKEEDERHKVVK